MNHRVRVGCSYNFLAPPYEQPNIPVISYNGLVSTPCVALARCGSGVWRESRGRGVSSHLLWRGLCLCRAFGEGVRARARRNAFVFGARTRGTGSDRRAELRAVQLILIHTRERLTSSPPHSQASGDGAGHIRGSGWELAVDCTPVDCTTTGGAACDGGDGTLARGEGAMPS